MSRLCVWGSKFVNSLHTNPDQAQGARALDRVSATACALPSAVPNSDAWWVPSQSVLAPCATSVKLACTAAGFGPDLKPSSLQRMACANLIQGP